MGDKGVTVATAERIWNYYLNSNTPPEEIYSKINNNPYILIEDIKYIGFEKADELALSFEIDRTSNFRIQATIKHVLNKAQEEGHVYLSKEEILSRVNTLLKDQELNLETIEARLKELDDNKKIIIAEEKVYLSYLYHMEENLAEMIKELVEAELKDSYIEQVNKLIKVANQKMPINLVSRQKEAIKKALTNNISIITGGPGTGKSSIITTICDIYDFMLPDNNIHLASPTGKAANRMEELTGFKAKTIHRLLDYKGESFDPDYKIPAPGLLIVDEFSMCDLPLAYYLFKAVNCNLKVVLVGDTNQLPSIGPGNILRDLIESGTIPTTKLKVNFRQSQGSKIISIAKEISKGDVPYLADEQDFEYKNISEIEPLPYILDIFKNLSGNFDIFDLQVITPMNRGKLGVKNLNDKIQDFVNPVFDEKEQLGKFRLNDKVMVTKNNYRKYVFNGDMGYITSIDENQLTLSLLHNNKRVTFKESQLKYLDLAYACTIHKSQGSEFPYVIMILSRQHQLMLKRNLLYTGITRARKKLLLMTELWVFKKAIENNKVKDRNTDLKNKLTRK